ncbi:pectinesterase [Musa troglodytarum]|uniref:Pectinesterase n=1 Tax=Musa troglodytarum TaxID=320322 RepID=A0A9E7H473_9LILI|nr:pectinesterase [Musa troglodytarum]
MSKAIFGALSAVLLVAAVIGVGDGSLSTTSKSVSTFCAKTDYQADCERTIGSAINGSSSPKEVIQASFQAAIDEIQAGFHLSNNVSLKANDPMNKAAFNICRQLLEDADEELNAAFSETHDLQGLARRTDDIKTWLSAVISYQQTCLDGITDPELQSTMKDGLSTAAKVTSNAIAIVDELSSLLKSFKVPINITMGSRRLLDDEQGFPSWLKFRNYLGRPWKAYSRTIVMESTIGDLIQPEGWMPWDGDNFLDTLYYAEYNNRGPGAGTSGRVNWPGYHVIGRAEAQKYTVDSLIQGSQWIKYSNIRYFGGLKF